MGFLDKIIPNEVTRGFDKLGDMFMPKELAPFIGPLSMMFAGPLGMPLSLGLGQLASAKMHSGQLDPYSALGTMLSAQGYKARNPKGYGRIGRGLDEGIAGLIKGDGLQGFDFNTKRVMPASISQELETTPIPKDSDLYTEPLEISKPPPKSFTEKSVDFLDQATQDIGEEMFPGFTSEDPDIPGKRKFDLKKTLTTIGSTTSITAIMPLAEELKKQKIEDEKQEGEVWQKWFRSYKNSTGRSYGTTEYPDEAVMSKWKKYGEPLGLAMGGRVGYNQGGDTGIIAAAPGMPEGMQLDGRDGLFISQGVEEKADDVPAMLSKNEFVLTADAMKGFDKMSGGSGDPRAAAQKMYQFMDQMEAIA
tara:strand:- start:1128 stop:2213 length:1086 start_codon:yes stop_codon:yes gene_type:complete